MPAERSKRRKTLKATVDSSPALSLGSLDDLVKARRTIMNPLWKGPNLVPGDVLWSDPSMSPGLSPNVDRGIGLLWGPDCTEAFLKQSKLKVIDKTSVPLNAHIIILSFHNVVTYSILLHKCRVFQLHFTYISYFIE